MRIVFYVLNLDGEVRVQVKLASSNYIKVKALCLVNGALAMSKVNHGIEGANYIQVRERVIS